MSLYVQNLSDFARTKPALQGEIRATPYPLDPLTRAPDMTSHNKTPTKSKTKAGQKSARIYFRCTPADKEKIISLSLAEGVDVSEFCRASALNQNQAKAQGNRKELIQYLAQLGKIGSNVNQLAKAANMGETPTGYAIELAMQEVTRLAAIIREELKGGRKKNEP